MEFSSIIYFAYSLLGIGLIIFIHELGHFLAAKKAGVRVEKFSLGFDPTIRGRRLLLFSFKVGETEYVVGSIPFGGYVKMAGETALERQGRKDERPREDDLMGKPPGTRAMVFAAGAVFNIISAFIFFFLAFRIGVSFTSPVLGHVVPGRPGWMAGLRPADHVIAIDGKAIGDFHEIAISSALGSPDRPRVLTVKRGERILAPIEVVPQWTPEVGFHTIGVLPALDSEVKGLTRDSVAARAGIQVGDQFIGIRMDGIFSGGPASLSPGGPLSEYLRGHLGASFEVGVRRAGETETNWVDVALVKKPASKPKHLLGVHPALACVDAVRIGTRAAEHLTPGDRIRRANGMPIPSVDWIQVMERFGRSGPVEIAIESVTGQVRRVTVDAADLIQWSLDKDVSWAFELKVFRVETTSPLSAILRPGDIVQGLGDKPTPTNSPESLSRALISHPQGSPLWVRRGDAVNRLNLPAPLAVVADLGVEWDQMPPVIVLPGSAAAAGGLQTGARILEVDGQPIRSFRDLLDAVTSAQTPRATVVRWIPSGLETVGAAESKSVDLLSGDRIENYDEIGIDFQLLQAPVQAGFFESFRLGAKRTVIVAQQVFMTLKGLLSSQVSATNLQGPIGIIDLIRQVSEYGLGTLIYYLALISVNLGLFNLLPFPILDGGHLLFLAIEKVKGSPVSLRVQEFVTTVAFFLIIALALFVTWNDLRRILGL